MSHEHNTDSGNNARTRAMVAAAGQSRQEATWTQASGSDSPPEPADVTGDGIPLGPAAASQGSKEILVLRAGEQVWHFTEEEGPVAPGERRPILIVDEQTIHLAHTDRRLTPEELLRRMQNIIMQYEVPVEVQLTEMRWLNDAEETRLRILACLRDHPKKDSKMILGLDYMGKWATFNILLGFEPEPLPKTVPTPDRKPLGPSTVPREALLLLLGAVLAFVSAWLMHNPTPFAWMGGGLCLLAFFFYQRSASQRHQQAIEQDRAQIEAERKQQEAERKFRDSLRDKYLRTFKVDDFRLFTSAMRTVFEAVVDDIVEKGAKVIRIEGGQGGFFQGSGTAAPSPTPRHSDAADAEV